MSECSLTVINLCDLMTSKLEILVRNLKQHVHLLDNYYRKVSIPIELIKGQTNTHYQQ